MAGLGRDYEQQVAALKAADVASGRTGHKRQGDGNVRTQAKKILWEQVKHRGTDKLGRPWTWAAYNTQLKRAARWYEAAETLGWGGLLLIPADTVTPCWMEQTLRVAEWTIWLQLVLRVSPAAVQVGRDFDAWAGPSGLASDPGPCVGGPSSEASQVRRICEVPDTKDEDEDEMDDATETGSQG